MQVIIVFQAAVHSVTQKIIFIEGEDLEAIKKATLLEFLEQLKEDDKVLCPVYSGDLNNSPVCIQLMGICLIVK